MALALAELGYLHRYFEAVSRAISRRLARKAAQDEPGLMLLLGEMLDEEMSKEHRLEYPLAALRRDLKACGGGVGVDIAFKTQEHTRDFEANVSFADLGIVVELDGPTHQVRKGALVQAKRLFPTSGGNFALGSQYQSFDQRQFDNLRTLVQRLDAENGAYYLWFNPLLASIAKQDRPHVVRYEAGSTSLPDELRLALILMRDSTAYAVLGLLPRLDLLSSDKSRINDLRRAERRVVAKRPGIRVSGLEALGQVVRQRAKPTLDACYQHRDEHGRWHGLGDHCSFATFADFMVFGLLLCAAGSTRPALIAVAEGNPEPPEGRPADRPEGVRVPHTLRVRVGAPPR